MQHPVVLNIQKEGCVVRYRLQLPAELWCFDGHFPGQPVLAGVVQIHWAIGFGREHWPQLGEFKALEAVKFQQLIPEGREVNLELRFDADREKLHFWYNSDDGTHSSGRAVMSARPSHS